MLSKIHNWLLGKADYYEAVAIPFATLHTADLFADEVKANWSQIGDVEVMMLASGHYWVIIRSTEWSQP